MTFDDLIEERRHDIKTASPAKFYEHAIIELMREAWVAGYEKGAMMAIGTIGDRHEIN